MLDPRSSSTAVSSFARATAATALGLFAFASPGSAQHKTLTLEQASGRAEAPSFSGTTESWSWASDGVHLVRGNGKEARWVHPETREESEPPKEEEPEQETEGEDTGTSERSAERRAQRDAFEALDGVSKTMTMRIVGRGVARHDESGHYLSKLRDGGVYLWNGAAHVLDHPSLVDSELEKFSPDGKWIGFVSQNNLHALNVATREVTALTDTGNVDLLHGKLDWVYQEEIYGRGRFNAFWWSPDSAHIAFLTLDESAVHEFTLVDHIEKDTFRVKPEITHYPKAGDPNPTVQLGIAHLAGGHSTWADLSHYDGVEPLIVRVDWTPDSSHALFMVQDRIQTWADLNALDPDANTWTTWIREESDSWCERPDSPRWLADGSFLWRSDRTGYNHLYHYRVGGELVRAVTSGDWALGRILEIDEDAATMWFNANKDGAVNRNVYRIGLDGSGLTRLTRGPGSHAVSFNADRSLLLDRTSSLESPTEVRLCSADGEVLDVLASADIPARDEFAFAQWRYVELTARDGLKLDASLLKPVPFDEHDSYPVWISTYSGPDAPSVRNSWNSSSWFQFLAQQGVIVLQVNVRTASGKGHWAIEQCYKRLGVQELRDLEDAVDWLTAHSWADGDRVGITGYSYGGFMAAYALTHSDKFALAFAGGGVYDWGMYDTIYTERYMSTPQLNPEGYAATSVIDAAADLRGHLVMHHGVMDDNVHVQNAMQLAYALQKAGKDFEMMLYPQNRHGVRDGDQRWHLRQLEWRSIQDHLHPRGAAAPATPAVPSVSGPRDAR